MSVDIPDFFRSELGIFQCSIHTAPGSIAIFRWLRHMKRITTHTVACQLAINLCPSGLGELVLFQNQYPRTISQHKAISVGVPGSTGRFRIVVTRRQGSCCTESAQPEGARGHFSTSAYHGICITVLDQAKGLTNVVCTGRTGCSYADVRTFQPAHNGQVARDHIDDRRWNKEG